MESLDFSSIRYTMVFKKNIYSKFTHTNKTNEGVKFDKIKY